MISEEFARRLITGAAMMLEDKVREGAEDTGIQSESWKCFGELVSLVRGEGFEVSGVRSRKTGLFTALKVAGKDVDLSKVRHDRS